MDDLCTHRTGAGTAWVLTGQQSSVTCWDREDGTPLRKMTCQLCGAEKLTLFSGDQRRHWSQSKEEPWIPVTINGRPALVRDLRPADVEHRKNLRLAECWHQVTFLVCHTCGQSHHSPNHAPYALASTEPRDDLEFCYEHFGHRWLMGYDPMMEKLEEMFSDLRRAPKHLQERLQKYANRNRVGIR
jgi:hypothetical protein